MRQARCSRRSIFWGRQPGSFRKGGKPVCQMAGGSLQGVVETVRLDPRVSAFQEDFGAVPAADTVESVQEREDADRPSLRAERMPKESHFCGGCCA